MRKEVIYAIIAGVSIGLLVAFGTWKITRIVKKNNQSITRRETPLPKNISSLVVDNLKDFDVVNLKPIIKGLTSPNTDLVISTLEFDYYIKSNLDGEFEMEFELPSGISEIKIKNIMSEAEKKIILVYSTEVEGNLISYVGTVTDISSDTVQVKGSQSGILQISVNTDTSYVNTIKRNLEVKQTDLAIGDYIVAMGKTTANKVLQAQRILITQPFVENKIQAEKIVIEKLSKTKINEITLPKTWNGPNIKDLEIDQEIIIVGTKEEDKFTLRAIITPVE